MSSPSKRSISPAKRSPKRRSPSFSEKQQQHDQDVANAAMPLYSDFQKCVHDLNEVRTEELNHQQFRVPSNTTENESIASDESATTRESVTTVESRRQFNENLRNRETQILQNLKKNLMKFKYMQKSTQDIHNKFLQEIDHELERIKFELEHTQPLSEDDVVTQILRLSKNTYRGGGVIVMAAALFYKDSIT